MEQCAAQTRRRRRRPPARRCPSSVVLAAQAEAQQASRPYHLPVSALNQTLRWWTAAASGWSPRPPPPRARCWAPAASSGCCLRRWPRARAPRWRHVRPRPLPPSLSLARPWPASKSGCLLLPSQPLPPEGGRGRPRVQAPGSGARSPAAWKAAWQPPPHHHHPTPHTHPTSQVKAVYTGLLTPKPSAIPPAEQQRVVFEARSCRAACRAKGAGSGAAGGGRGRGGGCRGRGG